MIHCTRGRFAVLVSWSVELAVYSCSLLRLQMQVAKLVSGLFERYSLLRNNNMAANLLRSSYGRRRFAACDCWTQTSLAENVARQWLLIVVSFVVLCCAVWKEEWMKKKHCYANEARYLHCCRSSRGVTRFCIVSNMERISKISSLPHPLENVSVDARASDVDFFKFLAFFRHGLVDSYLQIQQTKIFEL